jgi:hypothetical protein
MSFAFTFGRRLIRSVKRGFVWIRPDGKQKHCPSVRSLVKAIMDYDGVWLRRILEQAQKLSSAPLGAKSCW